MNRYFHKQLLVLLGFELYLDAPDRRLLEQTILPWLSGQAGLEKVLFVGCDWYTCAYRKWFKHGNYATMDFNPRRKWFGSPTRHITDSMVNLSEHFPADSLDLIICTGVFGWGLDDREEIERAFCAAVRTLRPGGLFLFGWDDVPGRRPVPPNRIQALSALRPSIIEPLGVSGTEPLGEIRHVFQMFTKP